MTNDYWSDLGPVQRYPNDEHTCLAVEGVPVVILNVGGTFYALENRCPHAGLPLGDGERAGMTLICPYHGYTYHIKTGRNVDYPDDETPARTFAVRVEAGRVQVRLDHDDSQEA